MAERVFIPEKPTVKQALQEEKELTDGKSVSSFILTATLFIPTPLWRGVYW